MGFVKLISLLLLLVVGGVIGLRAAARVNLGRQTNWKFIAEFYEPLAGDQSQSRPVKTLIQGANARFSLDETALVQSMWLGSFDRNGATNLFATAPECLVDIKRQTATSPGPLQIQTGNGQLAIEGTGFLCQLTNVLLIISNNVETTIQRDLLHASRETGSKLVAELAPEQTATNLTGVTNPPLRIYAEHFVYNQASNTVVYSGNVRAIDPSFVLTSQRLIIALSTNGNVEQIEALEAVTLSTQDGTRQAFGDRAVYVLGKMGERMEIKGSPARWTDGPRSGHGPSYTYDPASELLRSPEPSVVRVPKSELSQPSLDLNGPAEPKDAAVQTNEFVEITAGYLETLPTLLSSNQTSRTLLASNGVVIVSPSDHSRATGHYATFSDVMGVFALHGDATWSGENDRMMKGDSFYFNTTNRSFQVMGASYLKLPLSSFGSNSPVASMFEGSATNRETAGTEYLEIHSDHAHYQTNRLRFGDQVKLFLRRGDELLARMNCRFLTLWLSNNEVQQIVAEHDVLMEQLPMLTGESNRVEKSLSSESFTVFMNTNGLIKEMVAQTNVLIRQVEYDPTRTIPLKTDLSSETVTAYFAPATNSIEKIVADGNVIIDQPAGKAICNQAVYDQASNNLLLNGDVKLETPNGLLNAPAAILRHFNLWPGRLNQLNVPLRNPGDAGGSTTNQPPASARPRA